MVEEVQQQESFSILANIIVTILLGIIFVGFTVIIPILMAFSPFKTFSVPRGLFGVDSIGGYFINYPGSQGYFWNGVQLTTVFRTYDQWAGLTPLFINEYGVAIYNEIANSWIFILLLLWTIPFILLGVGGTVLYLLPPIFSILKVKPPRYLSSTKLGLIVALIGVGVEWALFTLIWILTIGDEPYFGGVCLIFFVLGFPALYFGHVVWKSKKNWMWELKQAVSSTVFYTFVVGIILYCVFPFFWSVILSFEDPSQVGSVVEYFPSHPTLNNYRSIFLIPELGINGLYPFQDNILNSLVISSITTVLCVATGAFGGYVIAQFDFKSKRVILAAILSMTMFPALVILVPLYVEYIFLDDTFGIKMLNTLPGILIPYITFNLPLTLFLLQNFFEEIPSELIKAARVDGASNFQVFRKVILPLALPGVFTTGILVFIAAWNEFLFASLLLSRSNWTIPVVMASFEGISRFSTTASVPSLLLSAATVVVTLPLIVLVLIFQKQIISGITAGAVKG
ncbi:MAG: carbohydrate ABC transporter permease [Candidatus Thorarchaeota archaeon]